jgi:hypothetical protein
MPRVALVVVLIANIGVVAVTGCKESGNDYLDEGLQLLGEAERGDCKPGWDQARRQNTIDSKTVARCLDKTKLALDKLHKARELGVDGREVEELIRKTEAEVAQLESMLRTVARLQREQP